MEEKKLKDTNLENEETSKYGEFITSYFSWLSIEKQKDRANDLNNMTKK